jgi:hypothetical protein
MTPKGQAIEHMPQFMQREGMTSTAEVALSREIARVMQALMQGAGSQCLHLLG